MLFCLFGLGLLAVLLVAALAREVRLRRALGRLVTRLWSELRKTHGNGP
jgi:hypothetical protein